MLFGAGLMRSGWLRGSYSSGYYLRQAAWLLPLSVLIQLPAVALQWQVHWDYRWSGFLLQVPRELGSPLQAMGYLALCYGFWPTLSRMRIAHWLTLVGRMALSNYLLQTLICTTLFYRFGLYEQFDRLQLLAFVPLVWLANGVFRTVAALFRSGADGMVVAQTDADGRRRSGTQSAEVSACRQVKNVCKRFLSCDVIHASSGPIGVG